MIKGIGIDLVSIQRFAGVVERRGRKLIEKVFTPVEEKVGNCSVQRLAGRFAAKEAFFKALGTGFRGFKWRDLEVKNDELGAPHLFFADCLWEYLKSRGITSTHLSISHDREYAIAQVILEGDEE